MVYLSLSLAVAVFLAAIVLFEISHLPTIAKVRSRYSSSDKVILDRNNQIIDEVRVEKQLRRLGWIEIKHLPLPLISAVEKAERGFFAVRVAGLLDHQSFRNYFTAIALQMKWSRADIFEAYINLVRFRGELQGIGAASYGLFDKAPPNLSRAESAVLAALIRVPDAQVHWVRARACALLKELRTPEECGALSERHLYAIEKGYKLRPYMRMAPHAARKLAAIPSLRDRTMIRSTLDREIQWSAIHSLQKNASEGAVVVLENATGAVLAYVGNIGSASKNAFTDEAIAPREAESVLKPFIVGKALDEKILTAASLVQTSPVGYETLSVRTSLAKGLSLPTLKVLELLGVENFVQSLTDLGFTGLKRPGFYGPSLAIGSAEVRLLEVANAYRALANGGDWSPVRFSPDVTSEFGTKRFISNEAAFVISDILTDSQAQFWTAVANGSSWCVGYSEKFTVAVHSKEPAAPVFGEIMSDLHKQQSSQPPFPPPALIRSKQEWFLAGTEPIRSHSEMAASTSRFSFPKDQAVIPLELSRNPRLYIQIIDPQSDQHVYLDRRRLGRAKTLVPWQPQVGRHTLELRNSKGLLLDKVRFEVRGRELATAR